jgi:formate hydrogenlyase subunit 6/NADH:ubiquinone oxidoreductase subunit I
MGCGACQRTCSCDALRLERDPSKGEPLDIAALSRELRAEPSP